MIAETFDLSIEFLSFDDQPVLQWKTLFTILEDELLFIAIRTYLRNENF